MSSRSRVRAARWSDREAVAGLIADALNPTPLAAWLIPDPARRRQALAAVAVIWVEHAMFFGDIHLTDDLTATTVGFHRYRPIPPPANYHTRLREAAAAHTDRFELLDTLLADRQPTEPHYHLALIAVHPDARHAGLARAMLRYHRDRLNRVDLPSWTTTLTGGDRLLARYGYTPRPAVTLPDGPTLHPMRRNNHRDNPAMPINATRPDAHWHDLHA
ncbi:N-acetyltransferase [Micromonospora sp. NPDC047620]|uniref:N-acetyltransferase n=1 Tax=Micromonospora sp. NPDC047620 TaxID=3364251 RepID=UPI00372109C7